MQSFGLDSVELFGFASDFLKKNHGYEILTTHTGAQVCVSPGAAEGVKKRSLFLLGPEKDSCRQNISWVYKNLHPQALISVGFSDHCAAVDAQNDTKIVDNFVPATCLRSAGNTEFGGNPVLFEEIAFEPEIQKKIAGSLQTLVSGHLFGSDRQLKKKEDCQWLWANLDCGSWDQFTAELLLAGKRLHCPVGCVKLFGTEDTNRKKVLLQTIEKLML